MPRTTTSLSSEFSGHLRNLEMTRTKMERLLSTGDIVTRDINQVYVGLYLEVIASFERLIENLFIGLLSGGLITNSKSVVPLISFRNRQAIRAIVYSGRNYGDWLPYDRTEQLANRFFRQGIPFTSLDSSDKDQIRTCLYIRNAIAHKSRYSKRIFERYVLGSQSLMPRERTPVGYLRSIFRAAPIQRRYEHFTIAMATIASKLCG